MNQPLSAADRLRWLLRTYADAHSEYEPAPPDNPIGASTLPGTWHYYKELDHWLHQMRQCHCPRQTPHSRHQPECTRQAHAHLTERYIRPHAQTELRRWTTRITRTQNGQVRGLPPNSEPANPNLGYHTAKRSLTPKGAFTGHTMIARWHPWVRRDQVDRGIDWLLAHMHNGRTDRICLPPKLTGATPEPKPHASVKVAA